MMRNASVADLYTGSETRIVCAVDANGGMVRVAVAALRDAQRGMALYVLIEDGFGTSFAWEEEAELDDERSIDDMEL